MKESRKYLIELPIDSTDAFDYEDASKAKYSVPQLISILSEEIKIIQGNEKQWYMWGVDTIEKRRRNTKYTFYSAL